MPGLALYKAAFVWYGENLMALSVTITNTSDTEREIDASLPAEEFTTFRPAATARLSATVHIDGFRAGHIPEAIIAERLGEGRILEEMAHDALEKLYPEILQTHKLSAIGRPEIRVTKLADGNPLEFKARITIIPDFDLPDYRAVASKIARPSDAAVDVSDADVDRAIGDMRKSAWTEDKPAKKLEEVPKDSDLPAYDDAFIARFGSFSSLDDFRMKLKESMKREKEMRARDRRVNEILDALASATSLPIPGILTDHETDKIMRDFEFEIERLGTSFADYLEHSKKTREDIRTENRPGAEKRVRLNLVLNRIAETEGITVPAEELSALTESITAAHLGAPNEGIRNYAEESLLRRKTIAFLENL